MILRMYSKVPPLYLDIIAFVGVAFFLGYGIGASQSGCLSVLLGGVW